MIWSTALRSSIIRFSGEIGRENRGQLHNFALAGSGVGLVKEGGVARKAGVEFGSEIMKLTPFPFPFVKPTQTSLCDSTLHNMKIAIGLILCTLLASGATLHARLQESPDLCDQQRYGTPLFKNKSGDFEYGTVLYRLAVKFFRLLSRASHGDTDCGPHRVLSDEQVAKVEIGYNVVLPWAVIRGKVCGGRSG